MLEACRKWFTMSLFKGPSGCSVAHLSHKAQNFHAPTLGDFMADGCKFYKGNSSRRRCLNHTETGS